MCVSVRVCVCVCIHVCMRIFSVCVERGGGMRERVCVYTHVSSKTHAHSDPQREWLWLIQINYDDIQSINNSYSTHATCNPLYVSICINTYTMCNSLYISICIIMYLYIYIYIYVYTCVCIHIYIHIHIHIHTHLHLELHVA